MCLFSHSIGKSVGEAEKLWGILNKTKQEMSEIQAKKHRHVAGGNTSLNDDSISGNPQIYFKSTNERLERLEYESRSLKEEFKIIQNVGRNLSDTEMKVRSHQKDNLFEYFCRDSHCSWRRVLFSLV